MEIRLSVLRKDKFILVHWFMDLQNPEENLSFNEKKKALEQERMKNRIISFMPFLSNSFMIVRFDASNGKLYLNEYETFKYKYPDESAYMGSKEVREYCKLDEAGANLLKMAMTKLGLSARAYDRILKVSRTIADLENSENILPNHVSEAIQYRSLDRELWNH